MEFSFALGLLQQAIRKLKEKNALTDVTLGAETLSPLFHQHPEKHHDFVHYMVITSNHNCHEELLDDPIIGFLMVNHILLEMNWTVRVLHQLHMQKYLLQIVEQGPVGITSTLLQELFSISNEEIFLGIAYATSCKITYLLRSDQQKAVSNIEKFLLSSMKKMNPDQQCCEKFGKQVLDYLTNFERFSIVYCEPPCLSKELPAEFEKEFRDSDCELETLEEVLNIWLECLEEMLKLISCDIWISWNELEIQSKIGNKIYAVECILQNMEISQTLRSCLCAFKIEPWKEEDLIAVSSIDELIKQVVEETSPVIDKWYNALSEKPETWKNPEFSCTCLSKIHLSKNPREIILKSLELLLSTKDVSLKEEFFKALQSSKSSLQMEILDKLTDERYIEAFFTIRAKQQITTAFNKLSTDSGNIQDLITLFMQCPTFVLENIFQLSTSSKENHPLCEKILQTLKPVLNITTFIDDEEKIENNLFTHVFQKKILEAIHTDKEWNNLTDFLKKDFEKKFLTDCLINNLETKLSQQDWNTSKYVTMMLESIIHKDSHTVMAGFFAQVLTRCSWDAQSFDGDRCEVYKICCDIVSGMELLELDSVWLRNILSRVPNYIQTHFCDLWFGGIYPKPSKPFLCLLIAARTKSIQVQSAMREHFLRGSCDPLERRVFASLFKILPIICGEEWFAMFNIVQEILSDKLLSFKLFSEAVTAFAICWDQETANCIEYSVQNLSILFKRILDEGSWSLDERITMFQSLTQPLEKIPGTSKDSCYFLMLPILLKCVKIKNDEADTVSPFLNSVDETWRDKFQEALHNSIEC